jgi:hypothetical protein
MIEYYNMTFFLTFDNEKGQVIRLALKHIIFVKAKKSANFWRLIICSSYQIQFTVGN